MAGRVTLCIVTALFAFGYMGVAFAGGSPEAEREIARGHALLVAARSEAAGEEREALLSEAVEAFKSGYEWFGRGTQVRSLLGAAQSYLMMQTPRRVFPFLWQATPLQRAERIAQQALVMQPDNAAAAFLLALVHGRYAQEAEDPSEAAALSRQYAMQAAGLGMPVAVPGASVNSPLSFSMHDAFLVLMYTDTRGTGEPGDLLFLYENGDEQCVGVVVADGEAYAMTADASSGLLFSDGTFEGVIVEAEPHDTPRVVILARQQGVQTRVSFVWNGNGFDASH
ncbi:MAG: hypothetical protein OXC69_03875 [Candidatus Tectomicrobia bacterium]|nr:hypothetical protein [Candidatus Tectomicrobia bacterium]